MKTFNYNQHPFATKSTQQTRDNQDYNQKTESHKLQEVIDTLKSQSLTRDQQQQQNQQQQLQQNQQQQQQQNG